MSVLLASLATASDMKAFGARLGSRLCGGDVVLLVGDLGAGKTTLAQGVATGMGITDVITSPTFVISRVHHHPTGECDLVHVDAYRLGTFAELDDLDLDADLDRSVVLVEWGGVLVDRLDRSPLTVRISRSDDDADDVRTVRLDWSDPRWDPVAAEVAS